MLSALLHWDGSRCVVFAAVVMPDHVHALIHPMPKGEGARDLAELVHSIKSYSAHRINELRRRRGPVWQDERYDRWVRHEGEFAEKEVLGAIESAFAADLGAPVISSRKPARRTSAKAPDGSRAKKAAKTSAKTKKPPAKKTAKRKAR